MNLPKLNDTKIDKERNLSLTKVTEKKQDVFSESMEKLGLTEEILKKQIKTN